MVLAQDEVRALRPVQCMLGAASNGERVPSLHAPDEPVSPPGHGVRGVTSEVGPMQCSVPPAPKQGVPPWSRGFNQVKRAASFPSAALHRSHSGRWHKPGALPGDHPRSRSSGVLEGFRHRPCRASSRRPNDSVTHVLRSGTFFYDLPSYIGDTYTRQWCTPHSDRTLRRVDSATGSLTSQPGAARSWPPLNRATSRTTGMPESSRRSLLADEAPRPSSL